jgi:hypothetical protein
VTWKKKAKKPETTTQHTTMSDFKEWYTSVKPFTRYYLTLSFGVTVAVNFGLIPLHVVLFNPQ